MGHSANREQTVAMKGVKDGLLITLSPTEEWGSLTAELAAKIDQQAAFYEGAKTTVDLGERPVPKDQLNGLKALLERRGMVLWAISSESQTTVDAAIALDLRTSNIGQQQAQAARAAASVNGDEDRPDAADAIADIANQYDEDTTSGILIRRTIRSGRRVQSRGHIVVFGDVNPGAEIIAAGDIVVWGRLRGIVHAGADGDDSAVVCALDMTPTQLRIAGHITTSPDDKRRKPKPEIASVRDRQIVVETWK